MYIYQYLSGTQLLPYCPEMCVVFTSYLCSKVKTDVKIMKIHESIFISLRYCMNSVIDYYEVKFPH